MANVKNDDWKSVCMWVNYDDGLGKVKVTRQLWPKPRMNISSRRFVKYTNQGDQATAVAYSICIRCSSGEIVCILVTYATVVCKVFIWYTITPRNNFLRAEVFRQFLTESTNYAGCIFLENKALYNSIFQNLCFQNFQKMWSEKYKQAQIL